MSEAKSDLRKACEAAARHCCCVPTGTAKTQDEVEREFADIIERHMTPVFERMRDEVIEECAGVAIEVPESWCSAICHAHASSEIRALKGVRP